MERKDNYKEVETSAIDDIINSYNLEDLHHSQLYFHGEEAACNISTLDALNYKYYHEYRSVSNLYSDYEQLMGIDTLPIDDILGRDKIDDKLLLEVHRLKQKQKA